MSVDMEFELQAARKAECLCGCSLIPPGTGLYYDRSHQHKTTSNSKRDRDRADARHKTCTICGIAFEASDIRWNRCPDCRVIPVITSMTVTGSGKSLLSLSEKITGTYKTESLDNGDIKVCFTVDGYPYKEYLTLAHYTAKFLAEKFGDELLSSNGSFTIGRQANGDLRISLEITDISELCTMEVADFDKEGNPFYFCPKVRSIPDHKCVTEGTIKRITTDIWKAYLPSNDRYPRRAIITDINFGSAEVLAGGQAIRIAESNFCGVDGEGMPRECYECGCGQYRPDTTKAEYCINHHAKDECDCLEFTPDLNSVYTCLCGHGEVAPYQELGKGHHHTYVLLGCGEHQIENINGLNWEEMFEFLYSCYLRRENPETPISSAEQWDRVFKNAGHVENNTIFAGYFLGYDFNMWLSQLPPMKAWELWTHKGQEYRKIKGLEITAYYDVHVRGKRGCWEIHMHADKMLRIRPRICDCPADLKGDRHLSNDKRAEDHPTAAYMYINDSGPFFQQSFMKTIDPDKWPEPRPYTEKQYKLIKEGKSRRSVAVLDNRMRLYNRTENIVLANVLERLRDGFTAIEISLPKQNWYGPGQAAQAWLKKVDAPHAKNKYKNEELIAIGLEDAIPAEFLNAARMSYYGGWFEIFAHGIVSGITYNLDINNAYPYGISRLPCVLHGKTAHVKEERNSLPELYAGCETCQGVGWDYDSNTVCPVCEGKNKSHYQLIHASVWGSNLYIGAMLHRRDDMSILRPSATRGWYWQAELEMAMKAGLIDRIEIDEWRTYEPCDCPPPMREMSDLYIRRLREGKDSAKGKAIKLTNCSGYGKFAQSVGDPPFANPIYASLITSGCRTQILWAIATHPGGPEAVLMIATDGIAFDSPHEIINTEIRQYYSGKSMGFDGKTRECSKCHGSGIIECAGNVVDVTKPCFRCGGIGCKDDRLGHWEASAYEDLVLFKPGVYWSNGSLALKTRGVPAKDFANEIDKLTAQFRQWDENGHQMPVKRDAWPKYHFRLTFSMLTCKQALQRTEGQRQAVEKTKETHALKTKKNALTSPEEANRIMQEFMRTGKLPAPDPVKIEAEMAEGRRQYQEIGEAKEQTREGEFRYWWMAARVSEVHLKGNSYPGDKRAFAEHDGENVPIAGSREVAGYDGRIYRSRPITLKCNKITGLPQVSKPYNKAFASAAMYENGMIDPEEYGLMEDGLVRDIWYETLGIRGR